MLCPMLFSISMQPVGHGTLWGKLSLNMPVTCNSTSANWARRCLLNGGSHFYQKERSCPAPTHQSTLLWAVAVVFLVSFLGCDLLWGKESAFHSFCYVNCFASLFIKNSVVMFMIVFILSSTREL